MSIGLLAALFITAGIAHWVAPGRFESIVPRFLPNPRMIVLVSGLAEFAGGVGVLLPATRWLAGCGLILLLLAVFPANIEMLRKAIADQSPWWWQTVLWFRLPLQPAMIYWVCRAAVR
ncbi:MAG: hypothetical protein ABI442_21305 [Gemmatimonadaceae bacterium]